MEQDFVGVAKNTQLEHSARRKSPTNSCFPKPPKSKHDTGSKEIGSHPCERKRARQVDGCIRISQGFLPSPAAIVRNSPCWTTSFGFAFQ
eukprot:4625344-Amphidinium_carterae.2